MDPRNTYETNELREWRVYRPYSEYNFTEQSEGGDEAALSKAGAA